eukprot:CAMPEP_0172608454 /NCGR_PEP_ID=MMETSP1068-20121228/28531_1 /TAXON_ID=35684 /ORGANISM="Pseudopedinella elastica, Strain CCMP716" /LENGTH=430 /DNA_ID=CAMNT_0013411729 /DNA_START=337 /DNA_END=1629 /DNA_ORIENTATION=-
MEAAKRRKEELKEKAGTGKRKFVRRGEIAALEMKEQEAKREEFEKTREELWAARAEERRGGNELNKLLLHKPGSGKLAQGQGPNEILKGGGSSGPNGTPRGGGGGGGRIELEEEEVKARLRSMGQPVTYFGESRAERYARLTKLEEEGFGDEEFGLAAAYGTRNVFLQQDTRDGGGANGDDDDDDDDDEDDASSPKAGTRKRLKGGAGGGASGGASSGKEEKAFGAEAAAEGAKAAADAGGGATSAATEGGKAAAVAAEPRVLTPEEEAARSNSEAHRRVRDYFKALLRDWEMALNDRPDHIKRTAQGKIDTKTQKQCKDYIRPLFKLCKRREVPPDILINLGLMMEHMVAGDFVKANDAYILTAIGNAAWPIGVTSVGIHGRSAHDKMQTGQVAHVMNNEMARKYLQSVKRLIRFEQNRRDVAPSKMVN